MRNDYSTEFDRLDLSGIERLAPRESSWTEVCSRLDATEKASHKNLFSFRHFAAIPLAASLVLICFVVIFTAVKDESSKSIPIENIVGEELSGWYKNLGENNSMDDLEILDQSTTISYLIKE
ncbi:MAG: hypothetical protein HUK20_06940 [Fibrobacter sp.]|nr:hypothetical protein [Fibrobacter sp.]